MTTLKLKVNSKESFNQAITNAQEFYNEHKYLNMTLTDKRSIDQNSLQFFWYRELEKQGDYCEHEYRCLCKLLFGVPIMVRKGDTFIYDILKDVDWNKKAAAWQMSVEWAKALFVGKMDVTSGFSTEEMKEYLDSIKNYFEPKGFVLPNKKDIEKSQIKVTSNA